MAWSWILATLGVATVFLLAGENGGLGLSESLLKYYGYITQSFPNSMDLLLLL
jgi:hypothetical protein